MIMTTMNKESMISMFEYAKSMERVKHYKKNGKFIWREAILGETILTIVSGKLETIKTITEDSVVLRNFEVGSSAETYAVNVATFEKRYDVDYEKLMIDGKEWSPATAKGEAFAYQYSGMGFKMMAPWGEEMIVEDGDYIANPVGGKQDDVYRIEKATFEKTYSLVE